MDTSGFYKYDIDDTLELFFGPNFVAGPTFELDRNNLEDRDNALNGSDWHHWYWFDTEEEAIAALVPPADPEDPEEPVDPPFDPNEP